MEIKEESDRITVRKVCDNIATKEDIIDASKKCFEKFVDYVYNNNLEAQNKEYVDKRFCGTCGNSLKDEIKCEFTCTAFNTPHINISKICVKCIEQNKDKDVIIF